MERRELRVRSGGATLHAESSGSGEPVVLLHGFTGDTTAMESLAEPLRREHRVIAIDLIGHGESDAPRDGAHYAMARCAAQVCAVLDALAIPRAHFAGYSMGGRVALHLCARRPERVASALLIGASAGLADPAAREQRQREDDALAARIERDGLEKFVDGWMALPLFASQARLGPDVLDAHRRQRLRNRTWGLANSLRHMGSGAQEPLHGELDRVPVPIRIAVGSEDAKFLAIGEDLAQRLPDASLVCVPNAGHAAHLENAKACAEIAREHFASHPIHPQT